MRYAWLENLVEDGLVRKEAAEAIYRDCSDVMEKTSAGLSPDLMKALIYGMAPNLLLGASVIAAQNIRRRIVDARTKAQIDMVRQRLLSMFPSKDREKAEARFNEVAHYAPMLAANESVMRKYLPRKVRNGMSDRDVQTLIAAQMQLTPEPGRYSAMSGGTKTASELETPEMVAATAGSVIADTCLAMHQKFDDDTFRKTAGHVIRVLGASTLIEMEKTAATPKRVPAGFVDQMKHVMKWIAPRAIMAGGLSAGYLAHKHIENKNMAEKLDQSYHKAMQMSPDSVLTNDPKKARQAFQTLAHFAPHVAAEPNAAKAYMTKLVSYDQGPGTGDIKDLAEIEKNLGSIRGGMLDMLSKSMLEANKGVMTGIGTAWEGTLKGEQGLIAGDLAERTERGL